MGEILLKRLGVEWGSHLFLKACSGDHGKLQKADFPV